MFYGCQCVSTFVHFENETTLPNHTILWRAYNTKRWIYYFMILFFFFSIRLSINYTIISLCITLKNQVLSHCCFCGCFAPEQKITSLFGLWASEWRTTKKNRLLLRIVSWRLFSAHFKEIKEKSSLVMWVHKSFEIIFLALARFHHRCALANIQPTSWWTKLLHNCHTIDDDLILF